MSYESDSLDFGMDRSMMDFLWHNNLVQNTPCNTPSGTNFQKDDDLDDDLDDQLLYSSDDEREGELSCQKVEPQKSQAAPQFSVTVLNEEPITQLPEISVLASSIHDLSDSEGTDTKDETDDMPFNEDNLSLNKIKIYRTISNSNEKVPSEVIISQQIQEVPITPETSLKEDLETSVVDEDEESDDDDDDRARDRFKSERDVKTIAISSRRRTSDKRDIPDTLEISKEDQEKLEEFDQQQKQKRHQRWNRGMGNRRGFGSQGRHPYGQVRGRGNRFPHLQGPRYPRGGYAQPQGPRPIINPPQRPPTSLLGNPPAMLPPFSQQPPPFPINIPPPNWIGMRNVPPPLLPGQTMPPIPQISAAGLPLQQPPLGIPASAPPVTQPQSTITVVSGLTRESETNVAKETGQGNPIPTVMSQSNRIESELLKQSEKMTRREAIYDDKDRDSPRLSVRVNRSSSRSSSPVPRNSKRLVLKPRRSRSPKSRSRRKKKSRRRSRSRSYSPRRRSRSRSHSPRRSPSPRKKNVSSSAAPKPGKILINPHFKGARKLPTSVAIQPPVATTASTATLAPTALATSLINPLLFGVPPPVLPQPVNPLPTASPINVNVPPPQLPTSAASAPSKFPPITVPPPVIPPVSVPPPGNAIPSQPPIINKSLPPPALPTNPPLQNPSNAGAPAPAPFRPNVPPPGLPSTRPPSLVINRPPRFDVSRPPPPISQPNVQSPPPRFPVSEAAPGQPPFADAIRPIIRHPEPEPTVHIRPVNHVRPQRGLRPQQGGVRPRFNMPRNARPTHRGPRPLARGGMLTGNNVRSRLKPPPASGNNSNQIQEQRMWQNDMIENSDYQDKLRQQAERRKEFLALKAKRRGKGPDQQESIVVTIRSTAPPPQLRSVKISNLASATKLFTIEKLMRSVGPINHLEINEPERSAYGSFHSPIHAKQFMEKYNRHMLDLSYISVSLLG